MNVKDQLLFIRKRVEGGQPLYHTRYNDGEINQMLELRPEGTWGSENLYRGDLGRELRQCFRETCLDRSGNVLLGSLINTDPTHEGSLALLKWMQQEGIPWDLVHSSIAEFWCQEENLDGAEEMTSLMASLRESKKCVLVCNQYVSWAKHCLGAKVVIIPELDAWFHRAEVEKELNQYTGDHIFVWCGGIAAKVWSWRLWGAAGRRTTHLDFGHTFDGVFGQTSREWMKRPSPMSKYYFSSFVEEVTRWIA